MFTDNNWQELDPELARAVSKEQQRQEEHIELIASENYTSLGVLALQGSVLTNKYAEGYPSRRYYSGCEYVDEAEALAIERVKSLFGADYANVQPHSGSQANMAAMAALISPNDKILGMSLSEGGHLTHGAKVNFSGHFYQAEQYGLVAQSGNIDFDRVLDIVKEHSPKLIIAGFSAYSREIDWKAFRDIADRCGAYLLVDMAHVAGLVAAGEYPNPVPHAHVVTSTTHKTLRGARGGIILSASDPKLFSKFNSSVFPGVQGGPMMHAIAGKAYAFKLASQPDFVAYQKQVKRNAKSMEQTFSELGIRMVTGGTSNHLLLLDLIEEGVSGKDADAALARAHLTVNKNMVPSDPRSPMVTSGLRVGTPAGTTRGFLEKEFAQIAKWITEIVRDHTNEEKIQSIRQQVTEMCKNFPVYPRVSS